MSIYLGIDVGTQSVKVLCYDAEKRQVLAEASSGLELISDSNGTREQRVQWWVTALEDSLLRIDAHIRQSVAAIGVSGQQHGFVPLAADGQVLAPVKLWCDTSTVAECEQITSAFGSDEACIAQVGNAILPGYTASKIRWLKNHCPELYEQLDTILLPHDYINYYLTGERVMECGDASGTGLLDIRTRTWHMPMLAALDTDRDLTQCLPPLIAARDTVGTLRRGVAEQFGLPSGTPVSAGGGDNMMAAIGTGNVIQGRLTVSLGTSGTLFAYSDTPVVDESGAVAAFCASTGGWLPLVCTMNCTVSTELVRGLFQVPVNELDTRIREVPVGSNGVMTLPFFNGERTPNLPDGKGCILGLDSENYRAENLMRSAMESAVYGLRTGLDAFRVLGCSIDDIRLTGGGSASASWSQMVADVFDLPVSIQKNDESAALGGALQACWMDQGGSLAELLDEHLDVDPSRSCEPDSDAAEHYAQYYKQYLRHVDIVTPLYT